MSLTLFPITALLLLLSGVGSPVHAASYKETVAALRKQFFGATATPPHVAVRSQGQRPRLLWHAIPVPAKSRRLSVLPQGGARIGPVRPFERKQYRTRFGFAEGAYLAVGPPAGDSLVIFG